MASEGHTYINRVMPTTTKPTDTRLTECVATVVLLGIPEENWC